MNDTPRRSFHARLRGMPRSRRGPRDDPSKSLFDFKVEKPEAITARCLNVPRFGIGAHQVLRIHSRQNDIACTFLPLDAPCDNEGTPVGQGRARALLSCHLQQKAQFNMPFRHRVNEG